MVLPEKELCLCGAIFFFSACAKTTGRICPGSLERPRVTGKCLLISVLTEQEGNTQKIPHAEKDKELLFNKSQGKPMLPYPNVEYSSDFE